MSVRVSTRTRVLKDERYADAWAELWLKPGAPDAVIDAAYRALSRLYHPDSDDGDDEAMTRLNVAYRQLKKLTEQP